MILSYLKITFRHLIRNKTYSGISIIGLTLGISCCLLIALYIFDELSYDQFHEKKERIFRVSETIDHNGVIKAAGTSFPVGPTMLNDYPEIENYTRLQLMGRQLTVRAGKEIFTERNFWRADSSVFEVFSVPLILGDPKEALTRPFSVVLTKELATKYFDSAENAINQTIKIGLRDYTITGIMEKLPTHTDIRYSALISLSSLPQQFWDTFNADWFRINCYTYLLFKTPINSIDFNNKLSQFTEDHIKPFVATFGESSTATFEVTPLTQLHFDNSREFDMPKGNMNYIYLFSIIGIFILIIACINFINLSLSQSIKRAKEVGIRKSIGADNASIRKQFLGETLIIAFIALLLGIGIVETLIPTFNNLTQKEISLMNIVEPRMLITIFFIITTIGLLAGSYPALVLSRFEPVHIIKGTLPGIGNFNLLRRALVLVQFLFSIFMIIGTIAIFNQMFFLKNKDLGFNKEAVLLVNIPQDTAIYSKMEFFKTNLLSYPEITKVSSSASMPGAQSGEIMFRIDQDGQLVDKSIKIMAIDDQFLNLMEIDLMEGRNFSKEIQTDRNKGFLINETAAIKFGWKDNPIGKRIQWGLLADNQAQYDGNVVGVIKDFHFASLHNKIEPLVMIFRPNSNNLLSIKLKGENLKSSIDLLESKWKEFAGQYPFNYTFLDERLNNQYQSEEVVLKVFTYFSITSLLIAVLGLFAITSYTVEQKVKEIGIRKILGASNQHLSWIISKDILLIVLLALVLISPICWIMINEWLESFSYKAPIPVYAFPLAGFTALIISFLTITYHIVKVAKNDPVKALRYE